MFLISNEIVGQKVILIDIETKNKIANANLSSSMGKGTISDKNGLADLNIFRQNDEIIIQHISYTPKKIIKREVLDTIFLLKNKFNNITHVEYGTVCFDKVLSYGTIIYGTYFKYQNSAFITCEDIHYYKGNNIEESTYREKLNILGNIFKNYLQQKAYNNNFIIFGLPFIDSKLNNVFSKIKEMTYSVSNITFYQNDKSKNIGYLINKQDNNIENIFKVKADVEQDIYSLYCKGHKCDCFYGYAGIFDYKTSVMMNNYYRKIKENKCGNQFIRQQNYVKFLSI